ncbi:MAG: HprK-related kinase A [Candidatus Edwardsbacteria bacterium]|nr:HprK-related kinase A [Candidatus Edwardsbacteria bacterium]
MRIGELSHRDILSRLRGRGLRLKTGPFVFGIRSPLATIAENLAILYADFPLAEADEFADFHVRIRLSSGLRRFFRTQSVFDLDGVVPFKPLPGRQAFALLEWGMNWCIYSHAHQYLMIHGAVLERGGHAILFPAPSGSGKSTLCAGLMCRGWRLLSDELILIDPATLKIHPLCRPVSLKNRSIDIMRRFAPEAVLTRPIPDTNKGTVAHLRPSPASVAAMSHCSRIGCVVFPRYCPDSSTRITPLARSEVFMRLVENAFNYSLLGETGFIALGRIVDGVEGVVVEYESLEDIIRALETRFEAISA